MNKLFSIIKIFSISKIKLIWIIFLPLAFGTCTGNEIEVIVYPYKVPVSTWEGPWMAYKMELPNNEIIDWIWGIKGFTNYKWGNKYTLKLKKEKIPNPPTDSPSVKYSLIEELSTEKADTQIQFTLSLKKYRDIYIKFDKNTSTFTLMDDIKLQLKEGIEAADLFAILSSSLDVYGDFTHNYEEGIILNNFSGDFDRENALNQLMKLYPDQSYTDVAEWGKEDFITFFRDKYSGKLWNELL